MSTEAAGLCSTLQNHDLIFTTCNILSLIPASFWTAVFASALTLSGVIISNRNNRFQLEYKTKAEAEENRKQRKHELRRSNYSEMTEALAAVHVHLASLPNLTASRADGTSIFGNLFSAASKIQLVSELKTAKLVEDVTTELGILWAKAGQKANPAQQHLETQQYHQRNAETAMQEWLKFVGTLGQAEAQKGGKSLNPKWVENTANYWKESHAQEQAAAREQLALYKKSRAGYIRWFSENSKQATSLMTQLLGLMRQDLEATGDSQELIQKMHENQQKMNEAMEHFIKELEE